MAGVVPGDPVSTCLAAVNRLQHSLRDLVFGLTATGEKPVILPSLRTETNEVSRVAH